MIVRSVEEVKTQLADLIQQVQAGGEIQISKDGQIVAILSAYRKSPEAEQLLIADDFDEVPPEPAG